MTNNEIVIALRSVAKRYEGKPLRTFETNINAMATDAADHIERLGDENNFLKAENERLTKENDELKNGFFQEHYKENECQELLSVKEAWRKESLHHIDLEAEIEALKHYCNECLKDLKNAHAENERLKAEVSKARRKALLEAKGKFEGHSDYHGDTILCKLICMAEGKEVGVAKPLNKSKIKAEARKEFVEKLKLHAYIVSDESKTGIITRYSVVTTNQIDNLLEDMEKDT